VQKARIDYRDLLFGAKQTIGSEGYGSIGTGEEGDGAGKLMGPSKTSSNCGY